MSHLKERLEKNCLNCKAEVQGRFCQVCGQENIETKETVWHLISHFFQDITHFDGKFFSTLKYLMIRPGFLSMEYMNGRRASYVNPIRMYIFTSAFFFLIFFSFFKIDRQKVVNEATINKRTLAQIEKMDSLTFSQFTKDLNEDDGNGGKPMTRAEFKKYYDSVFSGNVINIGNSKYKTKAQFDSALSSGKAKHTWLMRQLIYKGIEINEKYKNNTGGVFNAYMNILLHSLPQMFFISLPIFAFWLKLLYRRRKEYYYVSHGIFSLHFYIFIFIAMLVMFGLGGLNAQLNWILITIIQTIVGFGLLFYLYKAMRKFYRQRRAKTIFKFLILCFLLFITILILFLIFMLYSIFKL
ncbi:MAG: DUF3667 domain-containing protein [Ferruginibacter sp.]